MVAVAGQLQSESGTKGSEDVSEPNTRIRARQSRAGQLLTDTISGLAMFLRPLLPHLRRPSPQLLIPVRVLLSMSDGPPPAKKARFHSGSGHGNFKKMNKKQAKAAKAAANGVVTGNSDEVLQYAVLDLIGRDKVAALEVEGKDTQSPFQHLQEVEVNIIALGAHGESTLIPFNHSMRKLAHCLKNTGDGLGWSTEYKDWLVAVPFCVPGERVLARIYRSARLISHADLVRIISQPDASGSTMRDDSLVGCKYFNQCGGCQYQHIPYPTQLQHKQKVVQDAFRNFSSQSLS